MVSHSVKFRLLYVSYFCIAMTKIPGRTTSRRVKPMVAGYHGGNNMGMCYRGYSSSHGIKENRKIGSERTGTR